MKIAIPTIGSLLDEQFDLCELFSIFSVDETRNIISSETLFTTKNCDCQSNIPLIMQQMGVTVVLACKLPEHAEGVCEQYGINVYLGYSGNVRKVAETFLLENK